MAAAGNVWRGPTFAIPVTDHSNCNSVERIYAHATELHSENCETCVDHFFEVAVLTAQYQCDNAAESRGRQLHDSALKKVIIAGQEFGRLDPSTGLTVIQHGVAKQVPITHHRFAWRPSDFGHLKPVGDYWIKSLSKSHKRPGVGVPLVAFKDECSDSTFLVPNAAFSATARLHVEPVGPPDRFPHPSRGTRLELYDPFNVESALIDGCDCAIAKDLSAALAYRLATRSSNLIARFIRPNATSPDTGSTEGNLYSVQPYQRGLIPVVLIHGLLADPFTWSETVNELLAQPGFTQRFQLWIFEYPTGRTFFGSAAELRRQLESACRTFDPYGSDPALRNIILAGHSMGGLVAKLQITNSGNDLWNSIANRPISEVTMTDQVRRDISSSFFFRASPRVTRVVYFGTPHRGSAIATRVVGRLGSKLVRKDPDDAAAHANLIRDNPNVFSQEVSKRIPTSIDLLEPNSCLLRAVDELPVRCGVSIHSIIGDHCLTAKLKRSDGVVPVEAARDRRAMTELVVDAIHGGVKTHPDAIKEFKSILELHLKQTSYHANMPITETNMTQHAFQ